MRELKRWDESVKILGKSLAILIEKYGEVNLATSTC